ncbi:uncharacterized protein EI97DRAFT_442673 [Westerdykella ornata]|uniref:Uncharacterized protein n=1 Tax=Westerdykella ornata TaxID=318751 RepID=A0A6A6JIE6_WESOR|nr:uncharacterized protein EI97DRAFT_442673 [Westerdykella ornata]KAF2276192.1 hypothetical protein EI97DRAFT_442673 [Westerdykella ornata]
MIQFSVCVMGSRTSPPSDDPALAIEQDDELPNATEEEARQHVEELRIALVELVASMNINGPPNASEPATATEHVDAPLDADEGATTGQHVDASSNATEPASITEHVNGLLGADGPAVTTQQVDPPSNTTEPAIVTQYVYARDDDRNDSETPTSAGNSVPGLSAELMAFITRIADAMAKRVVDELRMHEFRLRQAVEPVPQSFPGTREALQQWILDRERRLDELLDDILEEKKLCSLGIDRCIAVSIGPHDGVRTFDPRPVEVPKTTLPSSPTLTTAAQPPNPMGLESLSAPPPDSRLVIPGKMVQKMAVRSAFEPSRQFTSALLDEFQYTLYRDLVLAGDHVYRTFVRERRLHCNRHGVPAWNPVCVFKVAEEDYEWVPERNKKFLIRMEWDCKVCRGHHGLIVTE